VGRRQDGERQVNKQKEREMKMEKMQLNIAPPNIKTVEFFIKGTAPLVVHKFSQKAILQIRQKQEAGSVANKNKKREAKNFDDLFNGSRHTSTEGWDGIPASAFRCAMISACRICGFKMTLAKMSIFINADGFDATEGTPLIKIIGDKAEKYESMVRIGIGGSTTDISVRAMYRNWGARLRVSFDGDQFSEQDVANLLMRVGIQVGICEGRPDSKNSAGMGWGTFKLVNSEAEILK
jgi:hypothetical protein